MVVSDFISNEQIILPKERLDFLDRIKKELDNDKLNLLESLINEKVKERNSIFSSNLGAEIGDAGLKFLADVYGRKMASYAFGVILFDVLEKSKIRWKLENIVGREGKKYVREQL